MQARSGHRGEMSQDSIVGDPHRTTVKPTRDTADPAHRRGKGAYNALSASSVGLELGLAVAIGLLIGWWLDQHFGTAPWLMLLWLALGLGAGFRGVFRAVRQADRAAEAEQKAARHG
jgi:ATP synthase protein I